MTLKFGRRSQMETAKVKEIMVRAPVTLRPEDSLNLANDIMSLGRIRHIPIVEDGRLVGILSQRDLFGAAVNRVFKLRVREERELLKSFRIDEVMHKRVITAAPDTTIKEAARLMAEKKIGCLPIVEGDELVGLTTSTNILRYLAKSEAAASA
jgi:acetoin utilization protein AcuB